MLRKCISNKTLAAKETCHQIKQIWTHHFGLVVICGKDEETEKPKDEKKKLLLPIEK